MLKYMICLVLVVTSAKAHPISVNKLQNQFDNYSVSHFLILAFFSFLDKKQ